MTEELLNLDLVQLQLHIAAGQVCAGLSCSLTPLSLKFWLGSSLCHACSQCEIEARNAACRACNLWGCARPPARRDARSRCG
eukprot:COSAG01_NODE_1968_length_8769_cov_5.768166_13_plen_82_part_00